MGDMGKEQRYRGDEKKFQLLVCNCMGLSEVQYVKKVSVLDTNKLAPSLLGTSLDTHTRGFVLEHNFFEHIALQ